MSTSFRPYAPEQATLLPPTARDWLPEDHLAHFISDTVEALDLSAFYAPYEGDGRRNRPFEPRMMLKVLIYAYATGTFSSRKIARKLYEDVAFRALAAENFPAHRTIAEFRQRHLEAFKGLFVQVVQVARGVGLIKLGTLAVDGSKIKANASKHKAMSYGRMKKEEERLEREIARLAKRAAKVDAQEDARYGADRTGEEIPEELGRRETRLAKIREAKQRLEAEQRQGDRARGRHPDDERRPPGDGRGPRYKREFGVPDERAQMNFTDPESRIMKRTGGGFEQCYNAQIAVDAEHRLIVANGVTQSASDVEELIPLLEAVESNVGRQPERVLADAGYKSERNFLELEGRRIDGYVAQGRERANSTPRAPRGSATARMARKMRTEVGRTRYRARKHIGEPPFGWIKSVLGFARFHVRGHAKVRGEWNLACLALDLRRLHGMMQWA